MPAGAEAAFRRAASRTERISIERGRSLTTLKSISFAKYSRALLTCSTVWPVPLAISLRLAQGLEGERE